MNVEANVPDERGEDESDVWNPWNLPRPVRPGVLRPRRPVEPERAVDDARVRFEEPPAR